MLNHIRECGMGSRTGTLTDGEVERVIDGLMVQLPPARRVLLVPPDITRCYSYAGFITASLYRRLSDSARVEIMPAVGTHRPMSREEQINFFGGNIPEQAFLHHDWRSETVRLGTVPGSHVREITGGRCSQGVPVEVNRSLVDGTYDLIFSIGQVVPHEVVGMANYSKNILVGLGGRRMINESHMIGAVCGLETIMGNVDTPVRKLFDYAEEMFLKDVPLAYILTVTTCENGRTLVHGVYGGASRRVFEEAADLAQIWNVTEVPARMKKVVAYLEPGEFSSTWVGNKSVYRTRMMIEDGGELLVIAPGLRHFGENPEVDGLIRRYGYRGTPYTMKLVEQGAFAGADMVPAHMIHSSSEDRFTITYAVNPANMTREEIEGVGYRYMDVSRALARYPVDRLAEGRQVMPDGEEIYLVKVPALGLWRSRC